MNRDWDDFSTLCNIILHNYINYILDHDHVHLNGVHRLQGHVLGVIRRDNDAHHIPKIYKFNADDTGSD